MKIKKGDTVQVIAGKDKGKTGKVIEVLPKKHMVRVEGVNTIKRHYKPNRSRAMPEGGILEKAGLIPACKLMVYSDQLKRPVRVGYRETDTGKKRRVAVGREGKDTVLD